MAETCGWCGAGNLGQREAGAKPSHPARGVTRAAARAEAKLPMARAARGIREELRPVAQNWSKPSYWLRGNHHHHRGSAGHGHSLKATKRTCKLSQVKFPNSSYIHYRVGKKRQTNIRKLLTCTALPSTAMVTCSGADMLWEWQTRSFVNYKTEYFTKKCGPTQ